MIAGGTRTALVEGDVRALRLRVSMCTIINQYEGRNFFDAGVLSEIRNKLGDPNWQYLETYHVTEISPGPEDVLGFTERVFERSGAWLQEHGR